MADIDNDTKTGLAAFAQKLQNKSTQIPPAVSQVVLENTPTPSLIVPTPQPTEPVQPVVVTPVAKVEEPVVVAEPVIVEKPWDEGIFSAEPSTTPEPVTIESLSSALKIENVKTKDDLVAKFNAQQAEIEELKRTRDSLFQDFDEDFKPILEIAKQKGNWKEYLAADLGRMNSADPVALFENYFDRGYLKPDGTIDKDAADLAISDIPIAFRKLEGDRMKREMIADANHRKAALLHSAQQRQTQFNNLLADASRNLPKSLSPEKIGITLEAKHSDYLYEGIRTGRLVEKHFGKADISGADPAKVVRTIALAEFGEKISAHQFEQGKAKAMKEHLNKAQNVQLNAPPIPPTPLAPVTKEPTAADKFKARESLMKSGGI